MSNLSVSYLFLPLHTIHGVLMARILKWFAIPFSSGPHLSEFSTMTRLSWVALQGMAHSFIELDKAVIHVISLVSFFVMMVFILMGKDKRLVEAS